MRVGLLKTAELGRLKTADSAYKKPDPRTNPWNFLRNRPPSNYANSKEYYVFFLTRFRVVDNARDNVRYPAVKTPHLLRYTTTLIHPRDQFSREVDAKANHRPVMTPGDGR